MLRTASLYPLCRELEPHLPSLEDRLRRGLALWVKGTLLAHNGCQDSVAAALEAHGCFETLRRELREWTCDDADRIRSWGPETEVAVEACFPELLRWVRDLWPPDRDAPDTAAPLVLALDPTHHRDAWVALVAGVVYRGHAIPVAWHVVAAQARGSWIAHCNRLLRQLAPAVPAGTPVHVLCDQGLGSRELWRQIVDLDWHPVLRYPLHITFRPTGGARVPARDLGGGPGTLWVGTGTAFGRDPMPGTLVVRHGRDHKEPWLLLTDTPPAQTDATLYACRHWIEQGFRGCKRGGWQWQRTRRTDPVRVARPRLGPGVA
ncbi:MAG: transposase, partial [Caldilineaceae bacterium]|nr:transposase [Caldilineaceae bacterium]